MVLVTSGESESKAVAGTGPAGFHVLPPPPPPARLWTRELVIAVGLALAINILLLLPLLFGAPPSMPPAEGPAAIEVEIVPPPQPDPQPEPEPRPEPQAPSNPFHFGSDEEHEQLGDAERAGRDTPRPLEEAPERAARPERAEAPERLPDWAQTIERSYSGSSIDGGREVGRGDAYGRMLRRRLNENLVLPPGLEGARIVPPQANVSFDRSGKLVALVLVRSSGSQALDRAMLEAITRSFPVPPIPAHITENVVTLPLTLDFQ
ncbi:MAG: TonB C-terminal domain-containing protein [Parvibaculum sp.]|nr:TonB C-terminal domain-containing protein [Parvibaculum sp.]